MDLNKLKSLYSHFAKHPESQWIMQWPNAVELYKFILEHDVKKVLGLGTGIGLSDAVMALAFKEKGVADYKIDSIEQYDKCINLANELIPIAPTNLKRNVNIIKANPIVWKDERMPYEYYSIFDQLPEEDYDLIINDGPAPFMEGEHYIDLPNGTIHKLTIEGKIKPKTLVVYDGRIQSLKFLERYFGDNYFLSYIPPRNSDFNVLERKDNPLSFKDDKLEMMKNKTTYFKDENTISSHKQGSQGTTTAPINAAK